MPKKRQSKAQPTPEQVAETVRTNAQELYMHYRDLLYRSDSKDLAAHAEAVVENEALGVLAYSIPPCDVEVLVDATMRVVEKMDALRIFNLDYAHAFDGFNHILKGTSTPLEPDMTLQLVDALRQVGLRGATLDLEMVSGEPLPSTEEQFAERTKRHREMEQSIRESAERMCKGNADILEYPDIKRNMQTTDLYAKAVAAHEALEVVVWNAAPANLDELDAMMQRTNEAMNAMTDRAFEIQQQNAITRGRPMLPFEEA